MADPLSTPAVMHEDASLPIEATDGVQPSWALLTGGALGAICLALCALFLGHVTGITIALVFAVVALVRRATQPAILFVAAAALCGAGLLVAPETAIFAAALCFGAGLLALASTHR